MYTNQTRLTGLSGIDTESMIKKLMDAETIRLTNLKKSKQKLEWKQASYRSVSTALKSFQTSMLGLAKGSGSLRLASTFQTLASSVKVAGVDSMDITVSAGSNSAAGRHTLQVEQVAKADAYESTGGVSNAIRLEGADLESIMTVGGSINVSLDGKTAKTISFNASDFAGVNVASLSDEDKAQLFQNVLNTKLAGTFGYDPKLNADGTVDNTILTAKLNATVDASGNISISSLEGHSIRSGAASEAFGTVVNDSNSIDTNKSLKEIFGSSAFVNGSAKFVINGKEITANENDSLAKFMKDVNSSGAGVKISYDAQSFKFRLEGTETGSSNRLSFGDTSGSFLKGALKLDSSIADSRISTAQDAVFLFNGKMTTRESNSFTIEGITISLTDKSEGKTFDINLTKDVTGALNAVKKFVEEYNKLIDAMNAEFRTARPKSGNSYYEPLSDAEKEAMSEKQIEEWEKNARTGMNYNDQLIAGIAREMRTMLYEGVKLDDGTTISLTQIGITTDDKKLDGRLVIDEEKFKAAFEARPDDIAALFTKSSDIKSTDSANRSQRLKEEGLAERLNDIINSAILGGGSLTKKAGSEDFSSTILNNDMYNQIKASEDKISAMLTMLARKEENYYLMFSKLETAIMQADSQMSYLQSMLGTGQ